jgi:AraC-like DNA-binding protein
MRAVLMRWSRRAVFDEVEPMLKTIALGCEELSPGHCLPRHHHLHPYAIVVIRGRFEQDSYAGRVRVSSGDLLIQPTLDAHANRMPAGRGATILRLPWRDVDDLGGVFALADLDAVVRAAERDPYEALDVARAQWSHARPGGVADDLPDLLAAELTRGRAPSLAVWAEQLGVARETVSRAFSAAFGVSARQFRAELKARDAWLRIVRTRARLAEIAASTGFADQAHMTRSVRALTGATPSVWRRDHRTAGFCRAHDRPPVTRAADR